MAEPRPDDDNRGERFDRDERFRKPERLLKRFEFKRAQRGSRYVTPALVVIASPNGLDHSRLGVVVSKKVGKSTVRTTVKRRLREAFRRNKARLPDAFDLVWIARRDAATTPFAELVDQAIAASIQAARRTRKGRRRGPTDEG